MNELHIIGRTAPVYIGADQRYKFSNFSDKKEVTVSFQKRGYSFL